MRDSIDQAVDAVGAAKVAAPKAWALFKTEWRTEYDKRTVQRGVEAAKRMAERAKNVGAAAMREHADAHYAAQA